MLDYIFTNSFVCILSSVSAGGDASQNTELDLSSNGLAELDFGPDEVFIISSAPSPKRPSFLQDSYVCQII